MFRIKFSLVFLLFLLISCGEGLIEEKTSEPIITSISPKEIFLGDTIIIEGSGFGIKNHASFLWFISETDSLIISSIVSPLEVSVTWHLFFSQNYLDSPAGTVATAQGLE